MLKKTDYIWQNGVFVPWDEAKVHVLTHTLHYGGGAFEGIRAYKTDKGPAIFRLKEHLDRLFYSAGVLKMESPWTLPQIFDACVELVRKNNFEQGYIRPLMFFGYGVMGLRPVGAPVDCIIACWPWGAYLPHDTANVKISSFARIHPKTTFVEAKLVGHYVNSMLATLELRGTEFHEALLLDTDGNISEGPGENIFVIKNKTIYTPKRGTILAGITRDTIMQIAKKKNIPVVETTLSPEDVFSADEAFFTGTAAEVTPIGALDRKPIGTGGVGPITETIKNSYLDIVYGRDPEFSHFLTIAA